jgi:hypothetical protein
MTVFVYTALFGGYDRLPEQPVRASSEARFVCFTDDAQLQSDTWEIRVVAPALASDSVRSARLHKILGASVDDDAEVTVWIDSSVHLRVTPEELIEKWLPPSADMAVSAHSYRESLIDEFDEVVRLNYDDRSRVFEQLVDYSVAYPDALEQRPLWTGILVRRRNERVDAAMRVWADHVLRYSRRDQLSVLVAVGGDVHVNVVSSDNFDADTHQWPMIEGRRVSLGKAPSVAPGPLIAEVRRAKQRIAELEDRLHERGDENLAALQHASADLRAQVEQGAAERARLEERIRETTRHAILLEEQIARDRAPAGLVGRLRQALRR